MSFDPSIDAATSSTLQGEAMDRMYRLQRHFYDLTRHYYLLGRDRLIDELDVPAGGTVLEAGCGTGRNLIRLARRYPEARVFGFDISDEMLKTAGAAIASAGLTGRIRIAHGDAMHFDGQSAFGVAGFDRVFFSYTLSMIPQWQQALGRAAALLAPEGSLRVADFGQCEELPSGFRALLFLWLDLFHVTPRRDLVDEMARLATETGRDLTFATGHRGYDWHLALGGHSAA